MSTTRERRHSLTRQAILQAALALLAEKGLEHLSLREVARKVDYSPAGLYEYFESKEDILSALREEGMQRLSAAFRAVPPDLPHRLRLVELCLAYLSFARSSPQHFHLIFAGTASKRTSFDQPPQADAPYPILLEAVHAAVQAGVIAPQAGLDEEGITYSLWALVHGMAALRETHLRGFRADFETIHRRAVEVFLEGFGT